MRKQVVFYNPSSPYYTLPLQFLALAAVIDAERYEVTIVDARIEKSTHAAHEKVKGLLPNAACVGISTITGTSIIDSIAVTAMVKSTAPTVPVVWGGWHPSILPEQCLREGHADVCVVGQGEMTFLDLLDAFEGVKAMEEIPGLAYLEGGGAFHQNSERKFIDINNFPPYDYALLPLETYFRFKGRRQIDFYSSQGCPYRCAFCADPSVYGRRWSGLKGTRMLTDVFDAVRSYGIEDVVFQDENFFANENRVVEFCRGLRQEQLRFTWTATSRADQVAPLEDALLKELAGARLRSITIGVESGSQKMLDFMKKDTLAEEALVSASKLSRYGIGAQFGFIVGLPEESFDDTLSTLKLIKEIKRIDPRFDFNIFFFTPYPGTELFSYMAKKGFPLPSSLKDWSRIDFSSYTGHWVPEQERSYVERFAFYQRLATRQSSLGGILLPLKMLARSRTSHDYYRFPVEQRLLNFLRQEILHQSRW